MKPGEVRPIVICVFTHKDRLFVTEGYDSHKKETFYRPLGGAIEFGERSRESIIREIGEEMGAEIKDLTYLDLIENVFTYDGQPGHEIVLVYEANFVDSSLYDLESVKCKDNGDWVAAMWKPMDDFRRGKAILYPEGVLDLLESRGERNLPSNTDEA
jgi:8-oxo-dGTP pyrophosphatase MutT (NUDIX family)